MSSFQAQATLFIVCCVVILSLLLGGWRERLGAIAVTISSLSGYLYMHAFADFGPWPFIIVDMICLVIFIKLCWKCSHPWPIWATAAHALNLICQLLSLQTKPTWALATALLLSGYGILLALGTGTFAVARRKRYMSAEK